MMVIQRWTSLALVVGMLNGACVMRNEAPSPPVIAGKVIQGHVRLSLTDGSMCEAPFPAQEQPSGEGVVRGCRWFLRYAYAPREAPPLAVLAAGLQRATAGASYNLWPFGPRPEPARAFTLRIEHADGRVQQAPVWQGHTGGPAISFSPPRNR